MTLSDHFIPRSIGVGSLAEISTAPCVSRCDLVGSALSSPRYIFEPPFIVHLERVRTDASAHENNSERMIVLLILFCNKPPLLDYLWARVSLHVSTLDGTFACGYSRQIANDRM